MSDIRGRLRESVDGLRGRRKQSEREREQLREVQRHVAQTAAKKRQAQRERDDASR